MVPRKLPLLLLSLLALPLLAGGAFLYHPDRLIEWLARRTPEVLFFVETEQPWIALTIDDGPDPTWTPRILDTLEAHQAQATFFLIGDHIPGNEALLERMHAEGHELANHLSADQPSILLSTEAFETALLETQEALEPYADTRWFRPGFGWISETMLATLRKHGFHTALGSVYPFDTRIPSAEFAARYILEHAAPGSILILHDFGPRAERTVETLERILPELQRQGFRLVTLTTLASSGSSKP